MLSASVWKTTTPSEPGETKTVVHRLFWRLDGENVGALGRFRVSMALTPENF